MLEFLGFGLELSLWWFRFILYEEETRMEGGWFVFNGRMYVRYSDSYLALIFLLLRFNLLTRFFFHCKLKKYLSLTLQQGFSTPLTITIGAVHVDHWGFRNDLQDNIPLSNDHQWWVVLDTELLHRLLANSHMPVTYMC